MKTMTKPARDAQMERAHEELMEAYRELIESDGWVAYLEMMALMPSYSAGNIARILSARPDATKVAAMRTWNRLGRRVRKGEKGIPIVVPMHRRVEAVMADGSVAQNRELRGFRLGYCWDVTQTEGAPLVEGPEAVVATGDAPEHTWDRLVELIESEGYSVSIDRLDGPNGLTNFVTREVVISDRLVGRGKIKTGLHELGHIKMHLHDMSDTATKEVEAESVAWLCIRSLLGADGGGEVLAYSGPYLAHWSNGDPALVEATAVKVRAVAQRILDGFGGLVEA